MERDASSEMESLSDHSLAVWNEEAHEPVLVNCVTSPANDSLPDAVESSRNATEVNVLLSGCIFVVVLAPLFPSTISLLPF